MCIPRRQRKKKMTENSGKASSRQSIDQSIIDPETQSIQTNQFKKGCASRIVGSVLAKNRKLAQSINHFKKKSSSVSIKPTEKVKKFIF